ATCKERRCQVQPRAISQDWRDGACGGGVAWKRGVGGLRRRGRRGGRHHLLLGPRRHGRPAEDDRRLQRAERRLQGQVPGDALGHRGVLRPAQDPVPGGGQRYRCDRGRRDLAGPVRRQRLHRRPLRPLHRQRRVP
ncbi:MAG: Maltodextrin ABC transporter, substrate-binding protein MdxE, partial [uncultured Rubrobacteraceae bacterium]